MGRWVSFAGNGQSLSSSHAACAPGQLRERPCTSKHITRGHILGGNIDWSGRYGAHDLLTLLATGKGPGALILDTIRGPRVATALGAEAVFGLSGALFQTLFLNPLAAPDRRDDRPNRGTISALASVS
ncbi:iron chelate uptake ABC transporter family permease subunit [Heliomarina baculiformis]|uniref:iron chelate uptake ABC transporter family permease subunit n=1 Tax=Heliomarina baculiformis TaxID=2872036 RepID=UPI0023540D02|nr:iron chelate uptake ABC transporter family permease subunit [Heliomarina baculiformis]